MTGNIKNIVLVGWFQDTLRTVIRWLKRLTNSIVTYEHMRCADYILAYICLSLGLLSNG